MAELINTEDRTRLDTRALLHSTGHIEPRDAQKSLVNEHVDLSFTADHMAYARRIDMVHRLP